MNETQTFHHAAGTTPQSAGPCQPAKDLVRSLRDYARERPDIVALWCLGVGFILGWKLKPW